MVDMVSLSPPPPPTHRHSQKYKMRGGGGLIESLLLRARLEWRCPVSYVDAFLSLTRTHETGLMFGQMDHVLESLVEASRKGLYPHS